MPPPDPPDDAILVGVISDTHGLLDPQVQSVFKGVAHIIHAGDIGGPEIMRGLQESAPVTAVRGNVDTAPWAWDLPESALIELNGHRILVGHIKDHLLRAHDPIGEGLSVVVTGHSHSPSVDDVNGVLYVNPGSAGRRRFHFPKAVALLRLSADGSRGEGCRAGDLDDQAGGCEATIIVLEPGSPRLA
jgi:putative phosphoesterase